MKTRCSQGWKGAAIGVTLIAASVGLLSLSPAQAAGQELRRLPVKEYRDKMKAGWIGQIIGVSWGAPTEGRYRKIMPEDKMPPFRDTLVNDAFGQDDLYVEMTFLRSMEEYGLDVSASARRASTSPTAATRSGWPTTPAARTCAAASPRPTRAIPSSTTAPAPSTTRSRPTTPA